MDILSFRLGGESYKLSRAEVEQSVRHADPRAIDKHYVAVNGRRYPPKQVLSAATGRPVVSFTTMEANRVLRRLGFELGVSNEGERTIKTESEALFETYLNATGLTTFSFEEVIDGSSSRPDYTLWHDGQMMLFEVKEFHSTPDDFRLGSGAYDPYRPIREKINAGREKFRGVREHPCCLVLYNAGKPLVHLEWQFVYGAMLGNMAIRIPFDRGRGTLVEEETQTGFYGGGGKMIRYSGGKPLEPQNRTISAIAVLERFPVGKRRFDIQVRAMEEQLRRRLTLDEYLEMIDRTRGTDRDISLSQLRLVVCENPYCYTPLPRAIFCGAYDERYGLDERTGGRITRVFAGEQILALERSTEREKSPMERIIEESMKKRKAMSEEG
jgi:hypothetical protein